jgi:hypothetical protein
MYSPDSRIITIKQGGLRHEVLEDMRIMMVIVLGLGFTGCRGGKAKVEATTTTTTLGQELMDLQKSYEQGIITEKEYKEAKKKLIEKRTKK